MNLSDVVGFVGSFMNFKLFEINKTPITPSSVIIVSCRCRALYCDFTSAATNGADACVLSNED
jgi:hypothetical protein